MLSCHSMTTQCPEREHGLTTRLVSGGQSFSFIQCCLGMCECVCVSLGSVRLTVREVPYQNIPWILNGFGKKPDVHKWMKRMVHARVGSVGLSVAGGSCLSSHAFIHLSTPPWACSVCHKSHQNINTMFKPFPICSCKKVELTISPGQVDNNWKKWSGEMIGPINGLER